MGADMIIGLVAHKRDAKLDFEAGKKFIETIDLSDEQVLQALVEEGLDEDNCFTEDGKPLPDTIRAELTDWVSNFENSLHGRDVTSVYIRDLTCYIAGGLSWGDAPEGCVEFWRVGAIPGLLTSIGFEENWHEPDPTVTPDEEAAAIESIKQVSP